VAQDRRATGVPPSNRRGTPSKSEAAQVTVGIDRASASAPVEDFNPDLSAWDTSITAHPGTPRASRSLSATVELPGGARAFVGVREIADHPRWRFWGKVEVNPSRVVDPEGHSLARVEDVAPVLGEVVGAAGQLVALAVPVDEMRVKRLDVARDFDGVTEPAPMLRSLASVHRPWSRLNLMHADAKRNGAQTLMVGARSSGVVRLYDQHAAYGRPPGSLRFEAECRSPWLQTYGDIKTIADVTPINVARLGLNRWEWSAMGVEVPKDFGALFHRVRAEGWSAAQSHGFIGWLVLGHHGMGRDADMSSATLAKYRRMQRHIGLSAPADVDALMSTVQVVSRLDFESGREVLTIGKAS